RYLPPYQLGYLPSCCKLTRNYDGRTSPRRGIMLFHRSRLLPFLHAFCMVFVLSYVFFDVLDLDGSNLSALASRTDRAVIAAEPPADAESPHRPARADLWNTVITAPHAIALLDHSESAEPISSSPFISARAHGYRVGLPRDEVPD